MTHSGTPLRAPATLAFAALAAGLLSFQPLNGQWPNLPDEPFDYETVVFPNHFLVDPPGPPRAVVDTDNTPANNPTTDEGAALGRVLFYDKNLSLNRTVSCASCHQQLHGFSDPNVLSVGFDGGLTGRHSTGLANNRFYQRGRFFWDERAATLEDQALQPIQDAVEMGLTLTQLVQRVEEQEYYGDLFTAAFGDATVTTDRIARAIAQFERSMVSFNSAYDEGRAQVENPGRPFPNFSQLENQGKDLFNAPPPRGFGCAGCHGTEAQVAVNAPQNIGLDGPPLDDLGAFNTFGTNNFRGAFKVPSLRNIAIRPPFMHDGRFATLEEVVDFYSTGIQAHPNLAPPLTTNGQPGGPPIRLNMTQTQKDALVAFLGTLTDFDFLTDERFSNPFELPGAASVNQVVINDDTPGRSMVGMITVMFDREVNAPAEAFTLTNLDTEEEVTVAATDAVIRGRTSVMLTFESGPSVVTRTSGNSLADGSYRLQVSANQVANTYTGETMSGDAVYGESTEEGLYRLFGDANGSGALDLFDFAQFRSCFGSQTGDVNFRDDFDANGNGMIELFDFAAFRNNF